MYKCHRETHAMMFGKGKRKAKSFQAQTERDQVKLSVKKLARKEEKDCDTFWESS